MCIGQQLALASRPWTVKSASNKPIDFKNMKVRFYTSHALEHDLQSIPL